MDAHIHLPFNKYPLYDPSNRREKKKQSKEENGICMMVTEESGGMSLDLYQAGPMHGGQAKGLRQQEKLY